MYCYKLANLRANSAVFFKILFQNAIVSFKELCGLSAVANLKQCILALSPRLTGPDNSPLLVFNLTDQYPNLEPQGMLPEVLKKVITTYDMVSGSFGFSFCCPLFTDSTNLLGPNRHQKKINYHYLKLRDKLQ